MKTNKLLKNKIAASALSLVLVVILTALFAFSLGWDLTPEQTPSAEAAIIEGGTQHSSNQYQYRIDGENYFYQPLAFPRIGTRFYVVSDRLSGSSLTRTDTQIGGMAGSDNGNLKAVTLIELTDATMLSRIKSAKFSVDFTLLNHGGKPTEIDQIRMQIESSTSPYSAHNEGNAGNWSRIVAKNGFQAAVGTTHTLTTEANITGKYIRLSMEVVGHYRISTMTSNYRIQFQPWPTVVQNHSDSERGFLQGANTNFTTLNTYGNHSLVNGVVTKGNPGGAMWASGSTAAADGDLDYGDNYGTGWGDGINRPSGGTRTDELIMDQGGSGANRVLAHWLTIPLGSNVTNGIANGSVSVTFSSKIGNRQQADATMAISIAWGYGGRGSRDFTILDAANSATTNGSGAYWHSRSVSLSGAKEGVTAIRVMIWQQRGGNNSVHSELFAREMSLNITYTPSVQAYMYGDGTGPQQNTTFGSVQIDGGTQGINAIAASKTVGGTYTLNAIPKAGYFFSHWRKNSGSGVGDFYNNKSRAYTIVAGDAFTSPIYWDAYFRTITTANKTVTYNGNPQGMDAPTGLPSGYTYTITYGGSETVPKNAGTYAVVVTIKGSTGEVMGTKSLTLTINKKDAAITANTGQNKFFGQADPALTYTATGLIGSETLNGSLLRAAGDAAGTYAINQGTLTNANNPNYNITSYTGATFTINKTTPVRVSASASDIYYGQLLSSSSISASYKNPYNSVTFGGTFTWNNPSAFLEANTHTLGYGFTPSDTANYNSVTSDTLQVIVHKATPIFPQYNDINIKYGQSLTAAQMQHALNPYDNGVEIQGTYTWQNPAAIPALDSNPITTSAHLFDFVPTGQFAANYNSVTAVTANVTATLSTKLERIAFGTAVATNGFEYDWETTKVVNNKARIGLKASPNDSQNYVFLGWQKGGSYKSVEDLYIYEMVSQMPAETDAIFTAVFAQYRLNGQLVKEVNERYTGTPRRVQVSVDLFNQNPGLYKIGVSMTGDSAPIGLGSFNVSFTITNTELNLPVFSPEIDFNVSEAEVTSIVDLANSDGYNTEIGWANSVAFRLSVTGAAAGAVQKYVYSTDNGTSWHDVPGIPANQPNCPIIFIAAASSVGQTYSEAYIFKAIHSEYGAGNPKSVASSSEEIYCKIDTVAPTLNISYGGGYGGGWTNNDVVFNINATGGGSGMIILYSTNGGASWLDTGLTAFNTDTATGPITYDGLSFTITAEQDLTYLFRAQAGTARVYNMPQNLFVKIDKTAPIITKTAINKVPNANGWIKDTATVMYGVSDTNGNDSGVLDISINNGADYLINNGNDIKLDNNDLSIFVSDYKVYTITATDIAGNTSTLDVQEKVDTKAPEFTTGGYTAGEWINGTADISFAINAGASGIKIKYSTDGGNTYTYWTEGDFLTNGEEAYQSITASHSVTEEQSQNYIFGIENGAGLFTAIPFGYINIDKTAPLIVDNDPDWSIILADYQGDSPWVNEDIQMKFVALDGHELFNSGIDHAKVAVTNMGESVAVTHFEGGNYQFTVNKCTQYAVSITDIAGNTVEKNFTLKVDQGEPSFTSEAFIGATALPYTFAEDLWLSYTGYGENAFVRFVFNMSFTPSGARMQYSTDGKPASDGSKLWYDLTGVLFEEGNENGLEQNVTIQVDVKNQQNNPYMVRIISGSGRVMDGENLGRIRIDFTPPVFETAITYYYNGVAQTNYTAVTSTWDYRDVEVRFIPGDTPSGVEKIEVRRYAIGLDYTAPETPYTLVAEGIEGGLFSFNMDTYAQYVIFMRDRAGNIFVNNPIIPKIDKTDGFSFAVDTNGYESGAWIYDEGQNVRFDFPVVFNSESGFSSFGPSGAAIEFSINGGAQWVTQSSVGQSIQSVENNGTLSPYMIASVSQMRTYKFRLISGAGRVYYDTMSYIVNKDTILPVVTGAAYSDGVPYDSEWTYNNVDFTLNLVVGPSRAEYFWAVSNEPQITSESELNWTLIGSLNESVNAERIFTVNTTTDNVYYYFRVVAGTGRSDYTAIGSLVKIDKATVSATTTAYYNNALYSGNWVNGSVEILVRNIASGPSGYTVHYQTRRIGADVFGEYLDANYNVEENILNLTSNTQNEYRIRLTSGAGREYHTGITTVRLDNDIPDFALISNGTRLDEPLQNAGWWVSDLSVIYNIIHMGESGYTLQYAQSADGILWSDWISDGIQGNTLLITDESEYGGTAAFYKMRVISGSGVVSQVNDYGEVKLDTNTYTISAEQFVSSTKGSYAAVTNIISTYTRGDIVDSSINMLSGYFLKSLLVKSGANIIKSEIPDNLYTVSSGFSLEISGENVTVELSCYKQISLIYNNRQQYLQNRVITPAVIAVAEAGFDDTYGKLDFLLTYNGSTLIPQDIGIYILDATIADDSFIILNPSEANRTMRIVYFSGQGYLEQEPYLVSSIKDLRYIDYYMSTSADYDYLGANRRSAAFLQTNDIQLTSGFTPVGGGISAFAGIYDGGNYKVYYPGEYSVTGDFGFFETLTYGSKVRNLGVEFDLAVYGTGIKAGLLAAEAYSAEIVGSYALGSINASGSSVNIGGLVGMAWNSLLGGNFADVAITATDISGNIGGLAGLFESTANYINFISNYTISKIIVKGIEREISAGAMLGLLSGTINYQDNEISYLNFYNMNNLTIYRVPFADQGYSKQSEWPGTGIEPKIYEVFRGTENIIGSANYPGWEQRTVASLTARRATALGIQGSGIESDPFLINTKDKLAALEIFPYANFEQSANLVLSDFDTLNLDSAFTGTYDGKVFSLVAPVISSSDNYGGFFGILKGTVKNVRLVDIIYDFSAFAPEAYYGGLAAVALKDSSIYNVIVSGSMTILNAGIKGRVYAGGIAGVISSSQIAETISLVNLNITNTYSVIAGGIVGQAEGESELNNIVSLARVSVNYSGSGLIGSSVGAVHSTSPVSGAGIYNISGNTYANGRVFESSIGSMGAGTLSSISSTDYQNAVSTAGGIVISGSDVLTLIASLYPFSGGAGTYDNPFIISNYAELLRIGDFMYADFELAGDITIGDYDGDGLTDDDYNYDFNTIGKGAVFTGTLDGKQYSIYGLTDSLFEINAGQVRNLTLNVYYAAYGKNNPALLSDPRATAISGNGDIVFGAVAKYNRAGGDIRSVIVSGEINIQNPGRGRVKTGGIIGIATGGRVMASISYVNISVKSVTADIGGIVGSVDGNIKIEDSIMLTYNIIILEKIAAYGNVINAGLIAGAVRSQNAEINLNNQSTNAKVFINGKQTLAGEELIGLNPYKNL